jgi:hypothetical protein
MMKNNIYFITNDYYDWVFTKKNLESLKTLSVNGFLLLFCYLVIFLILSKLIKNKKIKAILIGLITPFFFYYCALYLWKPLFVFLYVIKIDPLGLISGVIAALIKPLSLISGIWVTFCLLKNK